MAHVARVARVIRPAALALAAACGAIAYAQPSAQDWPQWRGPARTGVVDAANAPATWPAELKKGWSATVGEGYSSPIAGGGRVFVHARKDPNEVVYALDLASGKTVWEASYQSPFTKNPYAKQMAKGPYATPLLAGGRLYTLGTSAMLSAWDAAKGTLLWRKDYSAKIDTSKLFCGTAMSPIATKSGIVVHVGDDRSGLVVALDPATGKERWTREIQGPGYASPVELDVQGTRQIVTMTTRSVVGVSADTGDVLWEFPYPDEWNENIVTPVPVAGGVIVSGVRQGTRLLTVSKAGAKWTVGQTWHTPDVTMYMSSPVLVKGALFGHSSKRRGQFVAMDPATGAVRWSTEGRDGANASVIAGGDHLIFLTSESQLIVARADAKAFQEVRRYTVASSSTYAHPILLRDRVIVRDENQVTVWNVN